MFKLTIEDDEGKTTVVPLARDEITIGRLEGNTIRLTERNVSRRHARLVRQNGALYIEDLSSFNGVRVNGAKIGSATPLREGDEVQIGDYRLGLRGERTTAPITDRPTMPSIPAVAPPPAAPMGTVGGSVAIPTRASVAAMAAQPAVAPAAAPAAASGGTLPPLPVGPVPAPASGPSSPSATITQPGPAVRKSPPSPQPVTSASPSPSPQPFAAVPAVAQSAPSPKPAPAAVQPAPAKAPQQAAAPRAAAAPEVSDAQPTIPIRALGDTVPDPTATGAAARLVVITTDLQGMEFELDRPSVVIGRTDENDIVLPHRSISRHHAKVVRDGEHHTIVDLQSANGVRVNGEDYERIELNPGDVVELGHVKLRFVGALEDYVFKPGAVGGGPVKLKLGAVGLGLVGPRDHRARALPQGAVFVGVGRAAADRRARRRAPRRRLHRQLPRRPRRRRSPRPLAATPAAILAEARQAAGAEDWEKSKAALDRMSPTVDDPAIRRDALGLRRRVDTEIEASAQFAQFDEASGAKNYAEAIARYEQIPAESIYKRRAKPRADEARTLLIAEHMAAADKLRAAGKCAEVRTEVLEVMRLEPRNLQARDLVRLCKPKQEVAVAKPVKEVAPPPPVAARLARPRPSAPLAAAEAPSRPEPPAPRPRAEAAAADVEAADADVLMKQAREAWLRQQCGSAVDLSRKALHAKPGMTDAYQIIAVCSCTLKDADAAGRAYAKLDDKNRSLVRQLCQKNGISVGE